MDDYYAVCTNGDKLYVYVEETGEIVAEYDRCEALRLMFDNLEDMSDE